jgi:mono/diheme cytochrome c family protein
MTRAATAIGVLGLTVALARPAAVQPPARLQLELEDYAALPITGELDGQNTRGQLARVNYLRDEPGGRRFFVSDLNGPLYILDKQKKTFTTYLDFNGAGGRPGLFAKLTFERNFATGLTSFAFDPDYTRNGVFYTVHMEDPAIAADAAPRPGVAPGLDLTGYAVTPAIFTPTVPNTVEREVVLIEWKDRDLSNAIFEGTAREILRVRHPTPIHPLAEMSFNPIAKPGDPEWRVMYIGAGDAGSGEQRDARRLNPQRLDTLAGKILRIIPDLREHTATSTVAANGRYRVPKDNPFVAVEGARPEIWAYGLRNPHRLMWDVDPAKPRTPVLFAFDIGLVSWETVQIIHKGANYGYSLREGTQAMSAINGMGPIPDPDLIPVQISDTVARGTIRPNYPVIQYPHTKADGGDAIANGFVYRGTRIPALKNKLVFGDISTGRAWWADLADVLAADDGVAETVAPIHELEMALRSRTEQMYRARGGKGANLPGRGAVSGGRVDQRFAIDNDGELYITTKSDGMIRKVVGARMAAITTAAADAAVSTDALAIGKKAYDTYCAPCHGNAAQGALKAGTVISIIEEQKGKQPPDLTDEQWDHGSSDADIFTVIKKGVPPTMMAGYDGQISDADIRSIVQYIRTLAPKK